MRIKLIGMLIMLISCSSFSQKVMNLNEAVKIALSKNTVLQKSQNNIEGYESNLKSAYGGFLPSINATGTWSWSRSEDEGGLQTIGGAVINTPQTISESRNYTATLSSNWVLFDGLSNFANLYKNKNNLEAARLTLERAKQDIVFQTMSYYYGLLNSKKLLKVKEDNLKWNQKNYEIIKEKNNLGAVTLADVYAQQVKLGNAELELINAQNDFENQKSSFLYYLGLDVLEKYDFEDPEVDSEAKGETSTRISGELKELIDRALSNRPDYKSVKLSLSSAIESLTMARSGHIPSLSNYASYRINGKKPSDMFDNKQYQVGLTLSIPIFSGWSVDNRVQLAKVDIKNKEIELSDFEREVKKDILKNHLDLQASEKKLDVSEKNVIAAEENLKIEEEKYLLGSTTLLNVLIANSEYTNALSSFINAQYEFLKLKDQLEYLLGITNYKEYE